MMHQPNNDDNASNHTATTIASSVNDYDEENQQTLATPTKHVEKCFTCAPPTKLLSSESTSSVFTRMWQEKFGPARVNHCVNLMDAGAGRYCHDTTSYGEGQLIGASLEDIYLDEPSIESPIKKKKKKKRMSSSTTYYNNLLQKKQQQGRHGWLWLILFATFLSTVVLVPTLSILNSKKQSMDNSNISTPSTLDRNATSAEGTAAKSDRGNVDGAHPAVDETLAPTTSRLVGDDDNNNAKDDDDEEWTTDDVQEELEKEEVEVLQKEEQLEKQEGNADTMGQVETKRVEEAVLEDVEGAMEDEEEILEEEKYTDNEAELGVLEQEAQVMEEEQETLEDLETVMEQEEGARTQKEYQELAAQEEALLEKEDELEKQEVGLEDQEQEIEEKDGMGDE